MGGPTRAEIDAAVMAERSRRLTALRSEPWQVLSSLPAARTEKAQVLGRTIEFTTCVDRARDGRLLVMVRSDEPFFFGVGRRGGTEGFWISENGRISDATVDDILDFCG